MPRREEGDDRHAASPTGEAQATRSGGGPPTERIKQNSREPRTALKNSWTTSVRQAGAPFAAGITVPFLVAAPPASRPSPARIRPIAVPRTRRRVAAVRALGDRRRDRASTIPSGPLRGSTRLAPAMLAGGEIIVPGPNHCAGPCVRDSPTRRALAISAAGRFRARNGFGRAPGGARRDGSRRGRIRSRRG